MTTKRTLTHARRQGMTPEQIKLEQEADRLLTGHSSSEYPFRTANAEAHYESRHPSVAYEDYTTAAPEFANDPDDDANLAISAYGTPRDMAIWNALQSYENVQQAAFALALDPSTVSRTVTRIESYVRRFAREHDSWRSVYESEVGRVGHRHIVAGDPLPEEIRWAREVVEEIAGIVTTVLPEDAVGSDIHVRLETPNHPTRNEWRITSDQLLTLASNGEVRLAGRVLLTMDELARRS